MMQPHPIPNVRAGGCLSVQHVSGNQIAFLGAYKRADQIQLCAGIDHPSDAAKNSVHFAERPKSIDVNGDEARSLQEKLFVAHARPRNYFSAFGWPSCVLKLTQRKKNHAQASSQISARGEWSKLNTGTSARLTIVSDYHPHFIPEFVQATPHECAPAASSCPPPAEQAGAVFSGSAA